MGKERRMKNRVSRDRRAGQSLRFAHHLVVTDTAETEKNYLLGLQNSLPETERKRLKLRVCKCKSPVHIDRLRMLAAQQVQWTSKWLMLDRDQVEGFDELVDICERNNFKVAWSNPCIETWFGAYFGSISTCQTSTQACKKFARQFERQTGKPYRKAASDIYGLLTQYGDENAAIGRAVLLERQHQEAGRSVPSMQVPGTTVHHLISELRG